MWIPTVPPTNSQIGYPPFVCFCLLCLFVCVFLLLFSFVCCMCVWCLFVVFVSFCLLFVYVFVLVLFVFDCFCYCICCCLVKGGRRRRLCWWIWECWLNSIRIVLSAWWVFSMSINIVHFFCSFNDSFQENDIYPHLAMNTWGYNSFPYVVTILLQITFSWWTKHIVFCRSITSPIVILTILSLD